LGDTPGEGEVWGVRSGPVAGFDWTPPMPRVLARSDSAELSGWGESFDLGIGRARTPRPPPERKQAPTWSPEHRKFVPVTQLHALKYNETEVQPVPITELKVTPSDR